MNEVSLFWEIGQFGSADLKWITAEETVSVHTTYVGDGLGSLLQAAADLQLGSKSTMAFLPAEPGGTCLFFGGAAGDVYVQIVRFADMQSEQKRWSGGVLQWHRRVSLGPLLRQIVMMADGIIERYGSSTAYGEAWGGPFPVEQLEALRGR